MIAELPPQITLQCHGTRAGSLRGTASFDITIYVDASARRFVTDGKRQFGWPRQGSVKAISGRKITLWNIAENHHPFLRSWAEFNTDTRRYRGRISYNARALLDEAYSGTCAVTLGVPAHIQRALRNA